MAFQWVEKNLLYLGISRNRSTHAFYVKVFIGYLLLSSSVIFHIKFLYRDDVTIEEYTESLFMTAITSMSFVYYSNRIQNKEKFFELIDMFDSIIQLFIESDSIKRDHPQVPQKIQEAVLFAEKCGEIVILIVAKITPVCISFPKVFISLYLYYYKNLGNDAFQMIDETMSFPYDWRNPVGYFIATIQVYMTITYTLFFVSVIASFGIGCILIALILNTEIKGMIKIANKKLRLKRERSLALKRFIDLIECHSMIKQLIINFSGFFQLIHVLAFLFSTITICAVMLMAQMAIMNNESNPTMLVMLIVEAVYAFGVVFVICELSQHVSDQYNESNDRFNELDYLSFPSEVQRLLPIVSIYMQQSVDVKAFGSINCSRQSFQKVVNSAFSYFMVIRSFF